MTLRADRLFVLFRLAGFRLAIASERVLEVREGRRGGAAHGRLRYQGAEVARIDLRARFGLPPVSDPGQVIIARAGEALVALYVDLIEAVVPLTEAVIDLPEPLQPFLGDDVAGIGRLPVRAEGDIGTSGAGSSIEVGSRAHGARDLREDRVLDSKGEDMETENAVAEDAEPAWEPVLILGERALASAASAFAGSAPPEAP